MNKKMKNEKEQELYELKKEILRDLRKLAFVTLPKDMMIDFIEEKGLGVEFMEFSLENMDNYFDLEDCDDDCGKCSLNDDEVE